MEEQIAGNTSHVEYDAYGNPEEIGDSICRHCHIHEIDKLESQHSFLCRQCREEFIRFRTPIRIKLFLFIITVILIGSLFFMPKTINNFKLLIKAQEHVTSREYLFAHRIYQSLLEQYDGATALAVDAAQAAMNAQYFDAAADIIDTHLMEKDLNNDQYSKVTKMIEQLNRFYNSYNAVTDTLEGFDLGSAEQNEVISALTVLLKSPENDLAYINYVLGFWATNTSESIEYFKRACMVDEQFTYPLAFYANALRRNGMFDEARVSYEQAISIDACDNLSISGLGILELLNGDKLEGLSQIQKAYEMDPLTAFVAEAYIIALCENGQLENAFTILNESKAAGYEFDAEIYAYLAGNIELWQYYVNETGGQGK